MDNVVEVLERLAHRAISDPWLEEFRFEPRTDRELDALAEFLAPLVVPTELDHLLRLGGHWPGYLNPLPREDTMFNEAISNFDGRSSDRHWISFGSTWEQDCCYLPVLAEAHDTAPIGMFSGQMLTVCVPAPSIAALLCCFEVAIDVLGRDAWDPTWCDLITAAPRPDFQRSETEMQPHAALHQALRPLRQTWTSDHPCWDPSIMPFPWVDEPADPAVAALLGR